LILVSFAEASKEDDAAKYTKELKSSTNVKAKIEAATKLGELGQIKKSWAADAIPYLIEACKHSDAKLRAAAAEALGKVDPADPAKAVEVLSNLVKNDKDMPVREAAARGLSHMGPNARSALPVLREAANKTENKRQARTFMEAARTIGAKK
jgi:HEAT repeat protein